VIIPVRDLDRVSNDTASLLPSAAQPSPRGQSRPTTSDATLRVRLPCHICTGTGPTPATSAGGLGSPLPHMHRDWARPRRPLPHLHQDGLTSWHSGAWLC
jgi:hypothetical protein